MAFYIGRKLIKKAPADIIKMVEKPEPQLIEGFGSRVEAGDICKKLGFKKVFVITDTTLFNLGFHKVIVDSLKKNKIKFSIFSELSSEPTMDLVRKGRDIALDFGAQCIIAIGGGSVMDAGKMIAAWMTAPNFEIISLKIFVTNGPTVPMINIPSTAGTGAEISVGAIVKKSEVGSKHSTVIAGLNVHTVILDSELTVNAPERVTMACGIDAMSHGLEGVVGNVSVSFEDKLKSFECVKLVLNNLELLKKDPQNIEARQNMARAAFYGGNAINKQLAGYVHAFAHSIGAKYHVAHGVAIAICLYPIMKYQEKQCSQKLNELAEYCGYGNSTELLDAVKKLIDGSHLIKIVIPKTDYRELKRMIFLDSVNYAVPVVFKKSDVYHLLDEINNL